MSDDLAKHVRSTWGSPNFQIPARVKMLARELKMQPYALMNQAMRNRGLPELALPQAYTDLQMTPEGEQTLSRLDKGWQTKLDVLEQARANTTGDYSRYTDPGNMRPSARQMITGNTGSATTGPHADFRVWNTVTKQYIDPTPYLSALTVGGRPLTEQFPMTSPYGMRTHPVHGGRRMHDGVDYGTPSGTKVDVAGEYNQTVYDPAGGYFDIYNLPENMVGPNGEPLEMHGLHMSPQN